MLRNPTTSRVNEWAVMRLLWYIRTALKMRRRRMDLRWQLAKRGTGRALSWRAWLPLVNEAARAYDVEHGAGRVIGSMDWAPRPTRESAAILLANEEDEMRKKATRSNPAPVFKVGQRVICTPVVGKQKRGTVIDPTGVFGYPVDRRVVVPVLFDNGNADCVPRNMVAAEPSRLGTTRSNPRSAAYPRMSMSDVKRANAEYHAQRGETFTYFDRGTSRAFGGDKFWGPYVGPGGVFFAQHNSTGFSVMKMDFPSGRISLGWRAPTWGDRLTSADEARSIAKQRAQGALTNPVVRLGGKVGKAAKLLADYRWHQRKV